MKNRATLYSLCALAMALCGLVIGAAPASASIHNTPGYFHLANAGDMKCIDGALSSDSRSFDLALQWRCLNTTYEEWKFVPADDPVGGRTDLFRIVSNATGECLTHFPSQPLNGSPVLQFRCLASDSLQQQGWSFGSRGQNSFGPYFQLVNGNGQCLDLENGDPSDGVPMQVWDCNASTSNQRWQQL
jgi:hypothetical protein